MKKAISILSFLALVFLVGCGISDEKLDAANLRLDELLNKGLPDSLVSPAKVSLYAATESKKRGRSGEAKLDYTKGVAALDVAEAALEKAVTEKKPKVLADYSSNKEDVKKNLRGLHLKEADSLLAIVDSLLNISFVYKAENKMLAFDENYKSLKEQQKTADKIKRKVYGTWKYEVQASHSEDKSVNSIEKKVFVFYKNGKATFVEEKKGKSSPFLKEDWKFISKGTWDMKGDTIHVLTNKFACPKQTFWELHPKGNKKTWVKKNQPTYDSTVTDGSQDRFITLADLKEDYKRR